MNKPKNIFANKDTEPTPSTESNPNNLNSMATMLKRSLNIKLPHELGQAQNPSAPTTAKVVAKDVDPTANPVATKTVGDIAKKFIAEADRQQHLRTLQTKSPNLTATLEPTRQLPTASTLDILKKFAEKRAPTPRIAPNHPLTGSAPSESLDRATKDEKRAQAQTPAKPRLWEEAMALMQQKVAPITVPPQLQEKRLGAEPLALSNEPATSTSRLDVKKEPSAADLSGSKRAGVIKPETILLNVGGRHYETSKETLLKFPGSKFHEWFEASTPPTDGTRSVVRDKEGSERWFLDRNPDLFDHVIHYMRTDDYLDKSFVRQNLEPLLKEAKYYNIQVLIKDLTRQRENGACINLGKLEEVVFARLGGPKKYVRFREKFLKFLNSRLAQIPENWSPDDHDSTTIWINFTVSKEISQILVDKSTRGAKITIFKHDLPELALERAQRADRVRQESVLADQRMLLLYLSADLGSEGYNVNVMEKGIDETGEENPINLGLKFHWSTIKSSNLAVWGGSLGTEELGRIDDSLHRLRLRTEDISANLNESVGLLRGLIAPDDRRNVTKEQGIDKKIEIATTNGYNCVVT